jgi:hypothetical protein
MVPKAFRPRSHSFFIFLLFAFLFSLQVLPRLTEDAPAGDEPVDIGDGFYYWKGDVVSDNRHPPVAKGLQSLPLRFMGLQSKDNLQSANYEHRDYRFLFVLNRDRLEAITAVSRSVTFLFGLGIGLILFFIVRRESTPLVWVTLTLWAFEPALLAFSGFVLADVPLTFFFLVCIWRFQRLLESPSRFGAIASGFLTALAMTTKFSSVLLLPIYFILETIQLAGRKFFFRKLTSPILRRWLWILGTAFLGVALVYLPGTLYIPGFRCPLFYFWDGFTSMASFSGHPTYFRGILSTQNHWAYYPAALIFKSPLPFLLLLLTAFGLAVSGQLKIPAWQWMTPLIFVAALLPFHNIGIREILPVYPFFILTAARAGEWMWKRRIESAPRAFPILIAGLLMFQVLSVGLSFPSYLSYFNEAVPENQKIYWLGDSNLDIGQDTKRMVETAQAKGWDHIKLAAFGTVDPSLYGLKWDYWTQKDLAGPQPGWVYLVNAEFIQLGKSFLPQIDPILNGWMFKRQPTGMIGDTWYYFVIPGTPAPDHSSRVYSAPPYDLLSRP